MGRKPNLFLVGAPRCGTTSLMSYLSAHDNIFVAPQKEAHHFGSDLIVRNGFAHRDTYLGLFSEADRETYVSEASVFYLRSERAAEEIAQFDPEARILIMLREPIDMIQSMHARMYVSGHDDVASFEEALTIEKERMAGQSMPPSTIFPVECFFYRELALYAEQVRRYFNAFPREHVFVGLYEDLEKQPARLYGAILEFLGLANDGRATFPTVNPGVSSRLGQRVNEAVYRPSPMLKRIYNAIPAPLKGYGIGSKLAQCTSAPKKDTVIRSGLRDELAAYYAKPVAELSRLLERDLSHWLGS